MPFKKNTEVLKSPWFLMSLFVLLINDFYLKYHFSGFITGKLSDISGLFIFPFFFAALFPKHKKHIYTFTAILFTLWKFPISNGFIEFFNSNCIISINRVSDLTDLFTLFILPVSFVYFEKQILIKLVSTRFQTYFISIACIFSFCATSLAKVREPLKLKIDKVYKFSVNKNTLIKKYLNKPACSFDERSDLYYAYFSTFGEKQISINYLISIKKLTEDTTVISIDSTLNYSFTDGLFFDSDKEVSDYIKGLSKAEFEVIFLKNLNILIKKDSTFCGFYIRSKLLVDSMEYRHTHRHIEVEKKIQALADSLRILKKEK